MARRAGMNISRYWQIENGEGLPPSEDERLAIAEELGVRPSEIAWPTDVRQAVNG
jgi:transcriptional regulator with XRE-family HTH domain